MSAAMASNVVITGVSGRFPKCSSVAEFNANLFSGFDLITSNHERWPYAALEIPSRLGIIPDIVSFDASFFGMNPTQPDFHDTRRRLLTEVVYETIVDAGINPEEMRGTNTGVFLGMFTVVSGIRQSASSLTANGISYTFDLKGPSYVVDTACSSSLYAFGQAFEAIHSGICDAAIVCSAHLQLDPKESIEFSQRNLLSPEGKCKSFSAERNGFVKSEAIVAVLLQKSCDARRMYATIAGVGMNVDGYKEDGLCHPSSSMQVKLMEETYRRYGIDPNLVEYVESHGTGTVVGDYEEATALAKFFCASRNKPLLIGSVKSNLGHTEMASGLVSVVKALMVVRNREIPANLHYETPPQDIPSIRDGKLEVVTKNTPFTKGLIAINSFGIGGANSHAILKPYWKLDEVIEQPENYLVQFSGRTEQAVLDIVEKINKHNQSYEYLNMINKVFEGKIEKHPHRGFAVVGKHFYSETGTIQTINPIWFVYSGMGSQWARMGRDLMKFSVFRSGIEKCSHAVKKYGLDLGDLIVNGDNEAYDNVINCFTAIAAMFVGLTDLLFSIGIIPAGIIGHSLGEVGCAYADGTLTAEQATLVGFARGFATLEANTSAGLMAAVGLSLEQCKQRLPADIYIACDNCNDNVTISGPTKSVQDFTDELSQEGIFTKIVNTANIAFHCKYIANAGPILLDFLKDVISEPKARSSKWLSTAYEEGQWEKASLSSAEYHCHNYMNCVNFRQVLKYIPKKAITIEVSPRGLLQAILRRSLDKMTTKIAISDHQVENNNIFFLKSLGKLFLAGIQPRITNLFPLMQYPINSLTPMLSSLIQWDHSQNWNVPFYCSDAYFTETIAINMLECKNRFYLGHVANNQNLFPATGYMVLAWQTFAKMSNRHYTELSVVIEHIKFMRPVFIPKTILNLKVTMLKSGNFEIYDENSVVASGKIRTPSVVQTEFIQFAYPTEVLSEYQQLNSDDVYKELRLRGYEYSDSFRGILEADNEGAQVILAWNDNWVTFLDTMLQSCALRTTDRRFFVPISIAKIVIDPFQFRGAEETVVLKFNPYMKSLRAGGVEIRNLTPMQLERRQEKISPLIEKYQFLPYLVHSIQDELPVIFALDISLQIVRENCGENFKFTTVGFNPCKFMEHFKIIIERGLKFSTLDLVDSPDSIGKFYDLLLIENISPELIGVSRFIFTSTLLSKNELSDTGLAVVFNYQNFSLLKKIQPIPHEPIVIKISNEELAWIDELKKHLETEQRIYLISSDLNSGIMGLFNCLRLESGGRNLRIFDVQCGQFNIQSDFFRNQLEKDLAINVCKSGNWGSFRYLPLKKLDKKSVEHASIIPLVPGDLSSLTWVQNSPFWKITGKERRVKVAYSALNFRDTLTVVSKIGKTDKWGECDIGFEYSGVDGEGRRVMGILPRGGLSNYVIAHANYTWEIPENWTLEQAATVPVAYVTAYYGLVVKGQIKSGESILIHAGTGAVGLAAINIATYLGCEIFTTVGNDEKREYLKAQFPQLKTENIGNSRDCSFEEMIMYQTKGKGVDVVFNSLAGDQFQTSLRCVAYLGRFIEIGIVDLINDSPIRAAFFLKNCSFHGVVGKDLIEDVNLGKYAQLFENIRKMKPLNCTIFHHSEIETAFRFLANSKHIGKVLVEMDQDLIEAIPRTYFDPHKCYIIIGGLGGFGLELCNWLVSRGARKLLINSRSPPKTGYQALCLRRWSQNGVSAVISTENLTSQSGAEQILKSASEIGPLGGVFNLAMVLKDALFKNQTSEDFYDVIKPKLTITSILSELTENVKLEYFVVFSSLAAGLGNPTQPNYGFANSAIERLVEHRRRRGLPGLAVQFGPIGDVGYVIEKFKNKKMLYEVAPQNIWSCLSTFDHFLQQDAPVVSTTVVTNRRLLLAKETSIIDVIGQIFGVNTEKIDENTKLISLGMDSLTTFEIKHMLSREYDVEKSVEQIKNLTIKDLQEMQKKQQE